MTGTGMRRPRPELFSRHNGVPPTAEYLAERERLGMPSQALALSVACAWCGARFYQECTVRATGQRLSGGKVHAARAALIPQLEAVSQP